MKIKEIYEANEKQLSIALQIRDMLEEMKENNFDFSKDIIECNNSKLYYLTTANLSAQQKAPMGEKFLCKLLNFTPIPASKNCGDAVDKVGNYYEFKNSFTNVGENLNIRQIRLWQPINYYFCFYINEKDLNRSVFFVLTKEEMEKEVSLCGSCSHGTKQVTETNELNEYSITIPVYNYNNEKTKRWREKYFSLELKQKILGE